MCCNVPMAAMVIRKPCVIIMAYACCLDALGFFFLGVLVLVLPSLTKFTVTTAILF